MKLVASSNSHLRIPRSGRPIIMSKSYPLLLSCLLSGCFYKKTTNTIAITNIFPVVERLRQEDLEGEVDLGSIMKHCLKKKNQTEAKYFKNIYKIYISSSWRRAWFQNRGRSSSGQTLHIINKSVKIIGKYLVLNFDRIITAKVVIHFSKGFIVFVEMYYNHDKMWQYL